MLSIIKKFRTNYHNTIIKHTLKFQETIITLLQRPIFPATQHNQYY